MIDSKRNKCNRVLFFYFILMLFALSDCKKTEAIVTCGNGQPIVSDFTDAGGTHYIVTADGKAYRLGSSCEFVEQYFEPGFLDENYVTINNTVFIKSGSARFPTKNNFEDGFEKYSSLNSIFIMQLEDSLKFWNTMTLLSPLAPTIQEYVNLRSCIFKNTCSFLDNRIELGIDPEKSTNHVMHFVSVAPTSNMITAKASIESTITFFHKGDDVWYQARYFFASSGLPYSIVDFENQWFNLAPGPRVVILDGSLAVENKFGSKIFFKQPSSTMIPLPLKRWVTVKVHIGYSDDSTGMVEVWQDGTRIISTHGITMPTLNSIQTNLEIGITATDKATDLFLDDVQISSHPF